MVRFYKPAPKDVSQKHFALQIKGLDNNLRGIGQDSGVTWFVEGALPGEDVIVRAIDKKKNTGNAELIAVKKTSELRQSCSCEYADKCGGCSLQHMPLDLEVTSKVQGVQRLFKKNLSFELKEPSFIESSVPSHYRRVCRLSIMADRKEFKIGFREKYGKKIVEVEHCEVLDEALSIIIPKIREVCLKVSNFKLLGHVELVKADNCVAVLVRTINALPKQDKELFKQFGNDNNVLCFVLERFEKTKEDLVQREELSCLNSELTNNELPYYDNNGVKIHFRPTDFIQINSHVNDKMYEVVSKYLNLDKEDEILDLFCGLGNFTLPLAKHVKHVYGVELVGGMVRLAKQNATENNIDNAEFIVQDLDEEFERTLWAKSKVTKVLLDPGRQGAARVMPYLVNRKIPHIVYVSCNPLTLVRDIRVLLKSGYEIKDWSLFNMFPRTEHVETVVLLSRAK